jgi:DDE_Tnp_1-associated
MAEIQHVCLDEVIGYFDELEDPRSSVNLKHPLVSVVVIAMMAVLAGAGGPTAIAEWAVLKEEFLLKVLNLPNGIPRKDVFRRVLSLLKPGAFQSSCQISDAGSRTTVVWRFMEICKLAQLSGCRFDRFSAWTPSSNSNRTCATDGSVSSA